MKVIVPIAGRGSRFQAIADQNPEYIKPKPLIMVKDKPMVEWAVESLPFMDLPKRPASTSMKVPTSNLIFITLDDHNQNHSMTVKLKELFGNEITVLVLPDVTRGAVETVLKAKDIINTNEDIIITDCDNFFDGINLYHTIQNKESDVMGVIPVFQPPDDEPKWSYTLFDKDNTALAVGEKDPELAKKGAYANIGAYYFAHGNIFVQEAEKMMEENDMYGAPGKEEFYIAPLYQRLIKKGMKVKAAVIPFIWGLGTPKDLEYFLENYK